jgi:1,4-alpha-glucan branching enzyme
LPDTEDIKGVEDIKDAKAPEEVKGEVIYGVSLFGEQDIYLFREGNHTELYNVMGSHVIEVEGRKGTLFSVWAQNSKCVSV